MPTARDAATPPTTCILHARFVVKVLAVYPPDPNLSKKSQSPKSAHVAVEWPVAPLLPPVQRSGMLRGAGVHACLMSARGRETPKLLRIPLLTRPSHKRHRSPRTVPNYVS